MGGIPEYTTRTRTREGVPYKVDLFPKSRLVPDNVTCSVSEKSIEHAQNESIVSHNEEHHHLFLTIRDDLAQGWMFRKKLTYSLEGVIPVEVNFIYL